MVDKRNFITIGKLGTEITLSPYLTRQLHLIHLREAESLKKAGTVGQAKNGINTKLSSFLETGCH